MATAIQMPLVGKKPQGVGFVIVEKSKDACLWPIQGRHPTPVPMFSEFVSFGWCRCDSIIKWHVLSFLA
jgi:hypothetical protein